MIDRMEGDSFGTTTVLVTGGTGLVGGAVARHLRTIGYSVLTPTRQELDLLDRSKTEHFMEQHRPTKVVAAAAVVGGISANIAAPVDFLVENLEMQNNLLLAAAKVNTDGFIFMSSSCVYPRLCPQPMREEHMLTGPFEPTNASYAVAKVAGTQLASALNEEGRLRATVLVPSNIYGPGDTFDPIRAHVASALVRKFVDARKSSSPAVEVWGTGMARRELTHVHDLARATAHVLQMDEVPFMLNVGTGIDHSIAEIANIVKDASGYEGQIIFDPSKPDGMPRKVLDISRIKDLGWTPSVDLRTGLAELTHLYEASAIARGGVA